MCHLSQNALANLIMFFKWEIIHITCSPHNVVIMDPAPY